MKKAFTLAEVLIVLGVIGIVAALTIPTLLKNWQEDRWDTSAKVFENRLTEAVGQMHARQRLTGYANTADFVTNLKFFMKATDCLDCIIDGTRVGDPSTKFNQNWGTTTIGLTLVNGANMLIAYNPACNLDPAANPTEAASCVSAIYDTNGSSDPATKGADIREFNYGKDNTKICEAGWTSFMGLCISDSILPANNHTHARQLCSQAGGHLPYGAPVQNEPDDAMTTGNWFLSVPIPDDGSEVSIMSKYCHEGGAACPNVSYWLHQTNNAANANQYCPSACVIDNNFMKYSCYACSSDNYRYARCVK